MSDESIIPTEWLNVIVRQAKIRTVEDIKKAQAKQLALEMEQAAAVAQKGASDVAMDVDDEYGTGGLDDEVLGEVDLDI